MFVRQDVQDLKDFVYIITFLPPAREVYAPEG